MFSRSISFFHPPPHIPDGLSKFPRRSTCNVYFINLFSQKETLFSSQIKPVRPSIVTHEILVFHSTPRWREINRLCHLTLRVFVFDDECVQNILRDVTDHSLDEFHHGLV